MENKSCKLCCNNMPSEAVFCKECDSFQDWRRHFKFSSMVLALLVALFAVAGGLLQAGISLWPESPSNVSVAQPNFYGTTAYLIATNEGDRAATLEDAYLSSDFLPKAIKFDPSQPDNRVLQPGGQQVSLSPQLFLNPVTALEIAEAIRISNPSISGEEPAAAFAIAIRNSNGILDEMVVDVSHYELFKLVTSHAQNCMNSVANFLVIDPCRDATSGQLDPKKSDDD